MKIEIEKTSVEFVKMPKWMQWTPRFFHPTINRIREKMGLKPVQRQLKKRYTMEKPQPMEPIHFIDVEEELTGAIADEIEKKGKR